MSRRHPDNTTCVQPDTDGLHLIESKAERRRAWRDGRGRHKQLGPNGRGLCRWCWGEVPNGRSSWCSGECVEEYRLEHDWNHIRHAVLKRDRGVCAICGTDTVWISAALRMWMRRSLDPIYAAAAMRLGGTTSTRDLWEADHIHARRDGGSDHPDNLRTLCIPCHKARTAKQQAEWAEQRRAEAAERDAVLFGGAP